MLSQIRGQARAVAFLERALERDRVAHAYLFTGPNGAGKYTTALAFAAAMNCLDAPGRGCDTCISCTKIAAGIHPDIQTLERQGAQQIIPIETIRTQVIPRLGLPPHEARARFFLIEEAGALQGASANALLKTLEEPPKRTHFILCTTSAEKLLPTIRSRCQRVSFAALPADVRAEMEEDSEAAERLGHMVQTMVAALQARELDALLHAAAEATSVKDDVRPVLELFAQTLYQEARRAATDHDLDRAARLGRQAMIVLDTQAAVAHNAHGQLAIEAMLHTLRATA